MLIADIGNKALFVSITYSECHEILTTLIGET